jgi:hypothetical protein
MHSLDMYDSTEWHELDELACQIEAAAFAICPFIANPAAWTRITDADRHRPTFRTEQPFPD